MIIIIDQTISKFLPADTTAKRPVVKEFPETM
jgi:hypothetical protein